MQNSWTGEKLIFTYCCEADLPLISNMLSKETVCKWLFFGPNSDEATRSYFMPMITSIQNSLANNELPGPQIFSITEKNSSKFVGQCALLPVDFSPGAFLIGYQLDDSKWNKGYGTEACEFLIFISFTRLNAFRLNGDCVSSNIASKGIMEKCGFKLEGCQRKYWFKNDSFYDQLLFGLLKEYLTDEYTSKICAKFK